MRIKVVILDLDMTLWNHPDVSSMVPPFKRVGNMKIVDSEGNLLVLNDCVPDLLRILKKNGYFLAIASWNYPENALKMLELLDIKEFFDLIVIEPHPMKEKMIKNILEYFGVSQEEAVFIDDNPRIVERVRRNLPRLKTVLVGEDISDVCEIKDILGI